DGAATDTQRVAVSSAATKIVSVSSVPGAGASRLLECPRQPDLTRVAHRTRYSRNFNAILPRTVRTSPRVTDVLAGRFSAKHRIELVDIPEPKLEPLPAGTAGGGEILFQPELACLCGSDLPYFNGESPEFPGTVGHSL